MVVACGPSTHCGNAARLSSPAAARILKVSGDGFSTCALDDTGAVKCFGRNKSASPAGRRFVQISAVGPHACGLDDRGEIACWGAAEENSLSSSRPPKGPFRLVSVSATWACALRDNGEVWCWSASKDAESVLTLPDAVSITTLERVWHGPLKSQWALRVCYLTHEGKGWCTGDAFVPLGQALAEGVRLTRLEVTQGAYCGTTADGSLRCWEMSENEPITLVPPLQGRVVDFAVSSGPPEVPDIWVVCAIDDRKSVHCWGGTHTTVRNDMTECTPPAAAFTAVAPGLINTCGVRTDGRLACWGSDMFGACSPP